MNSFGPDHPDQLAPDRKEVAKRALIEAVIIKHLKAAHERTRAELGALFTDAGEREVGMLSDHRLGTVSLEAGREFWTVVDEDAFRSWTVLHHRLETELRVRPAFQAAILAQLKRDGAIVDPETGEAEIPDGVALRKAGPTLVERPDKHADFVVREWLGDAPGQFAIRQHLRSLEPES